MNLTEIASILTTVISDAPTLITLVEKLISIFKENRTPTSDEWAQINALVDAAHAKLQSN